MAEEATNQVMQDIEYGMNCAEKTSIDFLTQGKMQAQLKNTKF